MRVRMAGWPAVAGPPGASRGVPPPACRAECLWRLAGYLGGNWDPGRLGGPGVLGAFAVYPITAQLMSTPTEPYSWGWPVAGLTPVSRSGWLKARFRTSFSLIWRLFRPALTAFGVHM